MPRAAWLIGGIALVAVVVIGLLQTGGGAREPVPSETFDLAAAQQKLAGAPAPLAALHEQSSQLLEGGFDERLRALEGHPVVINKWGSWCAPCRAEFPVFQQVATELGGEVAFLGINGQDNQGQAREFLSEFPVPFPHYVDDSGREIADEVRAVGPFPMTVFVRPDGEVEIAIARSYESAAELKADIKKYLGV
jgi:cytochrome c biogenesis protein CcmG, thiol:disulfide interchange protein DsbE